MATIYTRAAKGSALTWTEGDANITNLNNDKIEAVVDDTTPQLGGNLDVNGNSIVSTANGDIAIAPNGTGIVIAQADLEVGYGNQTAAITSAGNNNLDLVTNSGTNSGLIRITAGANGDIELTPNGTGGVIIDGNEHPQTQGAVGQILVADGSGLLEWANQEKLTAKVINADSVQINKGEPVYVFGAQGDLISVKRAVNTGDSTSAQTLGLATDNIAVSAEGLVICQGVLTNVDTSTYTAGQALYLGATAGAITTTKPKEPNHLVYLGFVEKVNAVSGRIYVRVQNGYELDEIHDVNINNATALANNHLLRYNSASTRWENAALDIVTDTTPQLGGNLDVNGNSIVSVSNGNITITPNGTGSIVLDGLNWPQADGTSNQVLRTNGSGQLSFTTITPGIATVSADTTPSLGGNLNVNGNSIVSASNGNINIEPNGTGDVLLTADTVRVGDVNAAATITTNGTGNLVLNTNSGTNSGNITVTQGANANITLTPNGTGQTVVTNLEYNESIFSLGTTSGTIAPNVLNGNVQTITLNGNLTLNAFTSPVAGQSLTLIINTNGTGRTLSSTMLFAGGSKTLSTTNTRDIISVFYDGTTYYASLSKDFK